MTTTPDPQEMISLEQMVRDINPLQRLDGMLRDLVDFTSYVQATDFSALPINEMAMLAKRLKEAHGLAKIVSASINTVHEAVTKHQLPTKMADLDSTSLRVKGVGRVEVRDDVYVKTLDKDGLRDWLLDEGLDHLISETVNASSLKSTMRQRISDGQETPECVEVTPYSYCVIVK